MRVLCVFDFHVNTVEIVSPAPVAIRGRLQDSSGMFIRASNIAMYCDVCDCEYLYVDFILGCRRAKRTVWLLMEI